MFGDQRQENLAGDDKQFEWILGRLKSNLGDQFIDFDEDSPDYLFAKFRYRIISISYIKASLNRCWNSLRDWEYI